MNFFDDLAKKQVYSWRESNVRNKFLTVVSEISSFVGNPVMYAGYPTKEIIVLTCMDFPVMYAGYPTKEIIVFTCMDFPECMQDTQQKKS